MVELLTCTLCAHSMLIDFIVNGRTTCCVLYNVNLVHNRFTGGFWWCGITIFVENWWVPSHIHPVLGWQDEYSMATTIATTGSNWPIGVLAGYGRVKSHPSTMSFCPMTSYGSSVMSQASCVVHIFWKNTLSLSLSLTHIKACKLDEIPYEESSHGWKFLESISFEYRQKDRAKRLWM